MKTNKAKKRGKFPFPVIILALLGGLFLGSINLISGDSWIDGGAYIYPNSSLSNNVNVINGTLQVMNIPVCLMDGTNCPNMTGNSSQGPAGTNGTNGLNGTGIKNIYVLSNGSIVVNLTNGTNIISGNLTGPKGDTGSTGSQGPAGTNASVTSGDVYINISNGVVRANITAFDLLYYGVGNSAGYVSLPTVVSSIQNATICHSDGTNCPSGGNSSWNQSGYWNNASASFYPLKTNPQGFYNSSTIPAYVLISSLSGAVGQNLTYALINTNMGNWSADKASYATNVHVANVNATALKNATVASLAGLTVTSDATVEGVLVVYPGTATAAAVRVGGPLTTYSTLQFQSEQNRTRDFIFSSVNNSVASNRMAFRVSGNEAGSNSGGDLSVLRFDDSGGFIDTVMKIDRSDGFVGIGDSTPDAKLDVFGSTILDGEVNSTGHIRADGNSIPLMTAWVNKTIANQTVTGTTLANINDLGWLAEANKNYTFDCSIYYRSNTTTNGISFAIEDTGGTVTRIKMGATIETVSNTTVNSGVALAVGTKVTSTAVQAVNTPYQAFLTGTVINGGSAVTINPQFSAEVASLNSTIVQDSWCEVRIV